MVIVLSGLARGSVDKKYDDDLLIEGTVRMLTNHVPYRTMTERIFMCTT
jgi:hypothetical protein